jgi:hypothetical protein
MRSTLLSLAVLPVAFLNINPLTFALQHIDAAFESALDAVDDAGLDDETVVQVSNVLKTKHDTAKNAINNIR